MRVPLIPWSTTGRGAATLVLLTIVLYGNALGGGFVWDDEYNFLDNPQVGKVTVQSAFSGDIFAFMPEKTSQQYYRPLHTLTYSWLAIATRLQPFGMHLVSLLAHAAAGVLVFFLALELGRAGAGAASPAVAWFAAALFIAHPLHVEAVAWMSSFSEVLAALLMLASLWAVAVGIRGPRWWLAVAYVTGAAAYLTKETSLVLPFLAVTVAHYALRREGPGQEEWGARWRRVAAVCWPFFALAAGYVALRYAVIGAQAAPLPTRTLWRHAQIAAMAAAHYAKKLVWPWPLAPEYEFEHSAAVWLLSAAACAGTGWLAWRYRRARLALVLLVVPLLPALAGSIVLPAFRIAQDRYAYLAVLGVTLPLAWLSKKRWGMAACIALLVLWSTLSVAAMRNWRDSEVFWTHTLRVTPRSKTAVLGLGYWYFSTGEFEKADRVYARGLEIRPGDREFLQARANVRKAMLRE